MQAKQKPSSAGEQTAPGCRGEKMGRSGAAPATGLLWSSCAPRADFSQQQSPTKPPLRLLAGQELVPGCPQRCHPPGSVEPSNTVVPLFLLFLFYLQIFPLLPACCVCITPSLPTAPAWFPFPSPNMSSSPFSFCAAPRTSTASQTPPLSLPASPHALLSLSVSPSLTVWGESVCVNARIPLFIG